MSKARLIIAAVVVEGDTAFEPRSRRPHTQPDATPTATVDLIIEVCGRLSAQGLDAGADTEILTWLDDHSRYALSVTAHRPVTGPIVVTSFRAATAKHGIPFSTSTDNGLVFTIRFSNRGRTSRNGLENELVKLRVRQTNSRRNHPTTCGEEPSRSLLASRLRRATPVAQPEIADQLR